MTTRAREIAEAISSATGAPPGPLRTAGHGDINATATCEAGGETWFVKWNDHALPGQFEAEAQGLRTMRASGTSLVVPEPIAWSDAGPGRSYLIMQHLAPGPRAADFDDALGRGLAKMHAHSSPGGFGFAVDGACGATPQENGWMPRWVDFYRERRLAPQLRLARERGLSDRDAAAGARLLDRLEGLLDDDEPPAMIHGDLWSGNLHVTRDGRPALIDPAASYSHREAEFGMMLLFGGFSARTIAAYEESTPLTNGWRERVDLYSLYHVLNHFNLFGGGYGAQAVAIIRRYM